VKQFNNFFEIHLIIDSRTMQDILLKLSIQRQNLIYASANKHRNGSRNTFVKNKKTEQVVKPLLSFFDYIIKLKINFTIYRD